MAMATGCLHGAVDQRLATAAVLASISTTSLVSVRFAYTLPSPAEPPYSDLPPSGIFVIRVPASGSITVEECASPLSVKCKDAVRCTVVDDCVGILGGRDPPEYLESLQIEHDHGLVVTRGQSLYSTGTKKPGQVRPSMRQPRSLLDEVCNSVQMSQGLH